MFDFKEADKLGGSFNPMKEFKKEGDTLEGVLIGNRSHIGQYDQEVWTIKTDKDGDIDIWGCGSLNKQLERLVMRQNAVQITYDGDGKATKGNPPHLFTVNAVGIDEDNGEQISKSAIYKEVVKEEVTKEEDATTTTEED